MRANSVKFCWFEVLLRIRSARADCSRFRRIDVIASALLGFWKRSATCTQFLFFSLFKTKFPDFCFKFPLARFPLLLLIEGETRLIAFLRISDQILSGGDSSDSKLKVKVFCTENLPYPTLHQISVSAFFLQFKNSCHKSPSLQEWS